MPDREPPAVVSLAKHKRTARKDRAKGKTLCSRGFHKWIAEKHTPFDVKRGKLVTLERCARCGAERTTAR